MPPTGKLKPEEIAVFQRWVEAGLPWPEDRATRVAQQTPSTHWSFQPIKQSAEPLLKDKTWSRNSIDKFILARLEKEGLKPSPEADKATLIRRLSLDLLGLPPATKEVDEFLSDTRPGAYERLVDRVLASPHYGERWGRHWLDMARYADTNGFGFDRARVMWRYRDWVIRALNQDMPFDQFVIEQLAGDLLPNATLDQKIATGFHRNTMINEEGGVDQEQYRIEAVFDRVKTTGAAFLGLTTGCAQCHDHKYDPISQREFYQLFAFFNNQDEPSLQIVRPGQVDDYRKISADFSVERLRLQSEIAQRSQEIVSLLPVWESKLSAAERQSLPSNVQAILKVPPAARELAQVEDLEKFYKESDTEYQARLRALDQFHGNAQPPESQSVYRHGPSREGHSAPDAHSDPWRFPQAWRQSFARHPRRIASTGKAGRRRAQPPGSGTLACLRQEPPHCTGDRESGLAALLRQRPRENRGGFWHAG